MKLSQHWFSIGSGVYQSETGARIHIGGAILTSKGDYLSINRMDQNQEMLRCIRICGGNRRRGLMLAAEKIEDGEL